MINEKNLDTKSLIAKILKFSFKRGHKLNNENYFKDFLK